MNKNNFLTDAENDQEHENNDQIRQILAELREDHEREILSDLKQKYESETNDQVLEDLYDAVSRDDATADELKSAVVLAIKEIKRQNSVIENVGFALRFSNSSENDLSEFDNVLKFKK